MSRESLVVQRLVAADGLSGSWHWGGGDGHGKVAEIVEEGKAEVTSNKVSIEAVVL